MLLPTVALTVSAPQPAAAATTAGSGDCTQTVSNPDNVEVSAVGGDCVISFIAGETVWTVPAGLTSVRVLLVAGGGGGGGGNGGSNGRAGGGGGAGGFRELPAASVTAGQTLTVTVGAGGNGGAGGGSSGNLAPDGTDGGASAFGSETARGGGGGGGGGRGSNGGSDGREGGSGGGAGAGNQARSGGAGTADQGNAGGATIGNSTVSGGGGGAGAVGAVGNASDTSPGAGGAGKTSEYAPDATVFAVGGNGSATVGASSTTPGSGGAGGAENNPGGDGTTGIVIVRYSIGGEGPSDDGPVPGSPEDAAPAQPLDACDASEHNGLRVTPSHGPILYVDTGQSQTIDAGYLAYRVTSDTSRSDLWVQLEDFDGDVVSLVDPTQSAIPLGPVAAGSAGTRAAFFLVRATGGTTTPQSHVVRVYRTDPRIGDPQPLYQCDFTLQRVDETIKAAANKVDSITVTEVARLGDLYTITVQGDSGTIGQGNSDDGRMIWVSPAARSDWPTRALRLETTQVTLFSDSTRSTALSTHTDVLRINATTGLTTKNRQFYTAQYTFRVIGTASAPVPVIPIAMISSGTQVKHTDVGSLPTNGADGFVIDVTEPTVDLVVKKSADEELTLDTEAKRAEISYEILLVNANEDAAVSVDAIVDSPDSRLTFVPGSAVFDGRQLVNPTKPDPLGSDLVFSGPLEIPKNTTSVLTYRMTLPFDACTADSSPTLVNTAFAQVGDVVIGASATAKPQVTVSIDCTDGEPAAVAVVNDAGTEEVPPSATTVPASSITDTTARLNAIIDPKGREGHAVRFVVSESSGLGDPTIIDLAPTPTPGVSTAYGVTATATGLVASKPYFFRIEIGDSPGDAPAGWIVGTTLTFTTQDPPATPTATTGSTTDVAAREATLTGTVNPERVETRVVFEWAVATGTPTEEVCDPDLDTTTSSGFLVDEDDGSIITLDSAAPVLITFRATDLDPTTIYCFRIVARYDETFETEADGDWRSFTTRSPQQLSVIDPSDPSDPSVPLTGPVPLTYGDEQEVEGASDVAGLEDFTFVSEDPEVCVVESRDGSVFIRAIALGDCTIRVEEPGDSTVEPAVTTLLLTITAKALTIGDPDLTRVREYDATTAAAVTPGALVGVLPDDTVTVTASAAYDDAEIGTGKTITVTYTLDGTDAGNYITPAPFVVTDGSITLAVLSITDPTLTRSKAYDGTTTAAVTAGTLTGVVAGEDVTVTATATYDDEEIGDGKTITVTYTLDGDDVGNYAPLANFVVTDGSITLAVLSITDPTLTRSKTYDGTTTAAVTAGTLTGVQTGDDVTITASAAYDDANVGTGKTITVTYTLSGTDAGNYTAPAPFIVNDASITAIALTLTADPQTKVFGNDDPELTVQITSGGLIGTDEITGAPTRSAGENVGTYSITQGTLTAGGNYTLTFIPADLTITAKALGTLDVTPPDAQVVTGSALTPEVTITDGATTLILGTDFLATYTDNTEPGTATITLTGIGNYAGVIARIFEITLPTITVRAQTRVKLVGTDDPTLTFAFTDVPSGVGPIIPTSPVTITRTLGETIGSYPITTSGGAHPDFSFQHESGAELRIASVDVPGVLGATEPVTVERSDGITCLCQELLPGMEVTVTMFSTPVVLGTDTVTASGDCPALADLSVPTALPDGLHTLEVAIDEGAPNPGVLGGGTLVRTASVNLTTSTVSTRVLPPQPTTPSGPSQTGGPNIERDEEPATALEPPVRRFQLPDLPAAPAEEGAARPNQPEVPVVVLPQPPAIDAPTAVGPTITLDFGGSGGTGSVGANASLEELVAASRSSATVGLSALAGESFRGFAPGSGIRIEVIGARTSARFVMTELERVDSFATARILERSAEFQAADFARITDVQALGTQLPGELPTWSETERTSANDQFAASRLPAPVMLSDLTLSPNPQWVEISGVVQGYLPGSILHLTVTSSPVVLTSAVVQRDGTAAVTGWLPVEILSLGEHRIRFVGTRAFQGIEVQAGTEGDIQLPAPVIAEIERFDRGTDATVIVTGVNGTGGAHVALRIIPLDPVAPWWTLLIVLAAGLLGLIARRKGRLARRGRRSAAAVVILLASTPAVVLGWLAPTPRVSVAGVALSVLLALALGVVRPADDDPAVTERDALLDDLPR